MNRASSAADPADVTRIIRKMIPRDLFIDEPPRKTSHNFYHTMNRMVNLHVDHLKFPIGFILLIRKQQKKLQCMNGTECRPQAPVAEGGPVGFFDWGEPTGLVPRGPGE
jgi:transposase